MQTAVETLPEDRVRIRVEVDAHDVDHAFEHALRDLSRDLRVPGFRKGKVPPGMLRARIGNEAIVEEALRGHLSSWYGRAVAAAGVEPVARPEIDYDGPPAEGSPWAFVATVTVAPAASLPAELTLEAPRHEPEVPAEAIEARLERLRIAAAQLEPIEDAPAESGQLALIDFAAAVNGKPMKNGSAQDYLIEIGSGRLLEGIEQALIGLRPGDSVDVDVELPADHAIRQLAGKTAVFHVELKELKRRVLPNLDDDLARATSEFETFAELRADVERGLAERAAAQADGEFRAAVLHALGDAATVEIPEAMVSRRVEERLEGAARGLGQRGVSFADYLKATGQTIEAIVAELEPEARRQAREELALKAFAEREQIAPSDEQIEAFVREQAAEEKDPEQMTRTVMETPAARETMREELRLKLALDRAVELATPITVVEDAAPAAIWTPATTPDEPREAPAIWTPGSAR